MVNIKQIPFYRDKKNNIFSPRFLTKYDDSLLNKTIAKFQEALLNEEDIISKESFLDEFSDYKLGICVFETLQSEFYPYSDIIAEKLDEIVKYRLEFWKLINEEFGGFVIDTESRERALKRFQRLLPAKYADMSPSQISDMVFQDYSSKRKRIEPDSPPNPTEVRKSINNWILKTIFRNSQKVIIKISKYTDLNSKQIKQLFFLSKKFGVYSTVTKNKNGGLEIILTGPEELIGRKEKYGRKILAIFNKIIKLKDINSEVNEWKINIEIPWGRRNRVIDIDFSSIPEFFIDNKEIEKSMDFDSLTEEAFYRVLANLYPWEVSREPVVIFENDKIFLPDFSIHFAGHFPIYIEVIGFWTKDYKTKKIDKLTELSKAPFPLRLILIADKSLNFPSIAPFVKFEYEKNDYHSVLAPLNRYLKTTYLRPYEKQRLKELKSNLLINLDNLVNEYDEIGIISEKTLLNYFNLFNKNNLRDILINEKLKDHINRRSWRFIPRIGLIKKELIIEWRKKTFREFSKMKKKSLNIKDLSPIFPEFLPEGAIPLLLEYFGFKIQFLQLESVVVLSSTKKQTRV